MFRIGLYAAASVTALSAALFAAGTAAAGEINGHLYLDRNGSDRFDVGDDPGPVTILIVRRVVVMPGDEFQVFTRTQPDGSYRIVVPPGTYMLRVPLIEPAHTAMMQILADGTIVEVPGGVPVAEGPPTTVDLPIAPPPAPAFRIDVANNVVAGLTTYYTTIPEVGPADQERSETLGVIGSVELPLFFFDPDTQVVMERTPSGGATETYQTSPNDSAEFGWVFTEAPLAAGDHVRLYILPGQAQLDGYQQVFPEVIEFDYAGGLPPTLEFRLRPSHTLSGRAFLDACPTNSVYAGADGDAALEGLGVRLFTFESLETGVPQAETTTAADGTYSFDGLLPGFYFVDVDPVGAATPPQLFRTFEADPPEPANFPIAFDWAVSIDAPGEMTVECTAEETPVTVPATLVRPAAAAVSIAVLVDGDEWATLDVPAGTPPGDEGLVVMPSLAVGDHTVVVQVSSGGCSAESATTTVHIVDTTAPSVSCTVATSVIGPPMSGTKDVGFQFSATDECDPTLDVSIEVWSNETGSPGGGADAAFDSHGHLLLRRWRDPKGDCRVYLIVVRAEDHSGNVATACCAVVVPHSSSAANVAAADAAGSAAEATWTSTGQAPTGYSRLLSR